MNKKRSYIKRSVLVFKRWSRNGYASFISLQREVRIGTIGSNVAKRLSAKSGLLHDNIVADNSTFDNDVQNEEDSDNIMKRLSDILLLTAEAICPRQLSTNSRQPKQTKVSNNIHKAHILQTEGCELFYLYK